MESGKIEINRAPVLTLWASIVAERLGFDHDESLSLGKALAGLTAQSKGRRLGIFHPAENGASQARKLKHGEEFAIGLMGRQIPATNTPDGIRALNKDAIQKPEAAQKYIESKFGENLETCVAAMTKLAKAYPSKDLDGVAFGLYEKFRPSVPAGVKGWGAKGELKLATLRRLVESAK
jgi:hypothetical protein